MSTPSQVPPSPTKSLLRHRESGDRPYTWQVANTLLASFRYAAQGILYALRTQRNFRIHSLMSAVALSLGLSLNLAPVEMAILGLTCGAVLTLELFNTALEAVVDLTVQQTYHELAKVAKDCAAGAVMVAAVVALWVAAWLILPPLWALVGAAPLG